MSTSDIPSLTTAGGQPDTSATPPAASARAVIGITRFKAAFTEYKILALVVAIAVVWAFFSYLTDGDFLTARNLSNLLRQMAITGMLASGMVFVIIAGEIDLSVGSLLGLLGGVAAILDARYHLPLAVTLLAVVALGAAIGTFNGYWVAYRGIPSFIVTLAGLLAFRGILLGITNGVTVTPISADFVAVGQSYVPASVGYGLAGILFVLLAALVLRGRGKRRQYGLTVPAFAIDLGKIVVTGAVLAGFIYVLNDYRGIPTPVLILLVLLGVLTLMARRTVLGRRIYAIGGNLEATRLSGVDVQRVKLIVFGLMGAAAALAGVITTARLAAGSPSAGSLQELDAIASCIIGGTSMRGGAGTVAGALIGALIMASLDNGMSMLSVDTYWQMIVKGTILLLAVWLDIATSTKTA
ncbi:sugar ABC transporter permease [Lichenihabitans psoromatis]|uniref:sugar ABC transporter permease n=1 Tax=Lichenihabitans psoromatis TaxID=2528642 RepID=UPI001036BEC3|nr:sugar ABC transporter permease [Lichenihabitans psoromatis]